MEFEPAKQTYESPTLTELGSLHDLTLGLPVGKDYSPVSDGYSFNQLPINVS